jgi:hypothetical protein
MQQQEQLGQTQQKPKVTDSHSSNKPQSEEDLLSHMSKLS